MGRILIIIAMLSIGFFSIASGLYYVDKNKHNVLVIGAGSKGGEAYAMASAIANLAKKYDPGLEIIVAETGGSGQNNRMLQKNHLQLATIQADTKAGADTRLITMLYPDAYQLLVRDDIGIESISDLRGKTMGLPSKSSGQYKSFFFLAGHYGVSERDMKVINMSSKAASWALSQGAVDGVFRVRAPGNSGLKKMIEGGGVKILPIDQADALRLEDPAIRQGQIPAGSYQGHPAVPATDLPTPIVQRLLVSSKDVDTDLIERVTRLIYENRRELSDYSPLAGFLANATDLTSSALPLHPGAQKYFDRDNPSFLQENVEVFAFYATLLAGAVSLLLQMNGKKQKMRVDAYNRELIGIYNDAIADEDPVDGHYRNLMMDIFARVLKDSEEGNLSATGFEFLSFAWDELNDAIIQVVREKQGLAALIPGAGS
ncbi:MAG: TAXI family TRAP transporter solute-binding subunit [Rhizobiaceae bacterium]